MAIYYVGYITMKNINKCDSINSVNPQYLIIHRVTGQTEEKNGTNYLVLSPDNTLMDKYKEVFGEIKDEIEAINSDKKFEYNKRFHED